MTGRGVLPVMPMGDRTTNSLLGPYCCGICEIREIHFIIETILKCNHISQLFKPKFQGLDDVIWINRNRKCNGWD